MELFGGVHADGDRLGQGRDGERHIVGDGEQPSAFGRIAHEDLAGQSSLIGSAANLLGRMHDNPLAGDDIGDLGANGFHDAGQFVSEWHRLAAGPGEAAKFDVAQIAAADPAGMNLHDRVAWATLGQLDTIETHLPRGMDSNLVDRCHESSFK